MASNRNEIIEQLKEVFNLATNGTNADKEFSEDLLLTTDLGLTSVGVLYVVIAIEEFFGVQFDDVGFGDFKTVKNVVDYIENKVK